MRYDRFRRTAGKWLDSQLERMEFKKIRDRRRSVARAPASVNYRSGPLCVRRLPGRIEVWKARKSKYFFTSQGVCIICRLSKIWGMPLDEVASHIETSGQLVPVEPWRPSFFPPWAHCCAATVSVMLRRTWPKVGCTWLENGNQELGKTKTYFPLAEPIPDPDLDLLAVTAFVPGFRSESPGGKS